MKLLKFVSLLTGNLNTILDPSLFGESPNLPIAQ